MPEARLDVNIHCPDCGEFLGIDDIVLTCMNAGCPSYSLNYEIPTIELKLDEKKRMGMFRIPKHILNAGIYRSIMKDVVIHECKTVDDCVEYIGESINFKLSKDILEYKVNLVNGSFILE